MTDSAIDRASQMPEGGRPGDQALSNSRREAVHILAAWLVCLIWTVGFSGLFGYGDSALVGAVLGIPAWVFFGILLPWAGATVFSVWYALRRIADDPLERAPGDLAGSDQVD